MPSAQACRSAPVLFIVDDVQWADTGTLELLAHLSASLLLSASGSPTASCSCWPTAPRRRPRCVACSNGCGATRRRPRSPCGPSPRPRATPWCRPWPSAKARPETLARPWRAAAATRSCCRPHRAQPRRPPARRRGPPARHRRHHRPRRRSQRPRPRRRGPDRPALGAVPGGGRQWPRSWPPRAGGGAGVGPRGRTPTDALVEAEAAGILTVEDGVYSFELDEVRRHLRDAAADAATGGAPRARCCRRHRLARSSVKGALPGSCC